MSSLRNAVQRRPYKERAQPKAREQLGLLEKHKDYTLRARDYNAKQRRVKALRDKAANRNPEEFYFGMVRARTKEGVHQLAPEGSKPIAPRAMRALKAQDAAYLAVRGAAESKKIARLRAALHRFDDAGEPDGGGGSGELDGTGAGASGTHTIFVDGPAAAAAFDAAEHFGTCLLYTSPSPRD